MTTRPQYILICSKDRDDYINQTPSDFTITLPNRIDLSDNNSVSLASVILPNTSFNITSLNNTLKINSTTFTITPGSYDLADLIVALQNLVLPSFPNMTITFDTISSTLSFTNNVNFTLDMSIGKLYKTLAFYPRVYSSASSYSSNYAPALETCLFYFIHFDVCGQSVCGTSNTTASFCVPNGSANKDEFTFFNANNNFFHSTDFNNEIPRNFRVTLRDMSGNILQGTSDWCMLLAICGN
jgi:hypothetical protein